MQISFYIRQNLHLNQPKMQFLGRDKRSARSLFCSNSNLFLYHEELDHLPSVSITEIQSQPVWRETFPVPSQRDEFPNAEFEALEDLDFHQNSY